MRNLVEIAFMLIFRLPELCMKKVGMNSLVRIVYYEVTEDIYQTYSKHTRYTYTTVFRNKVTNTEFVGKGTLVRVPLIALR